MTPYPARFKVGDWVHFHFQHDGKWGFRRAQIVAVEWWEASPAIPDPDEWGYRMNGDDCWIHESDIIRKLSLLEIIAEVSREDGE